MRMILPFERIDNAAPYMDAKVFGYIDSLESESFEEHDNFDLLAFDWYDVGSSDTENSKIVIYLDKEDLFFFCENDRTLVCTKTIYDSIENCDELDNEQILYIFFVKLLKGDMSFLDKLEEEMSAEEENILSGEKKKDALAEISRWRKELLRLKRYYEQLDVIFDEMSANDNGLLEKRTLKRISILGARVDRYLMTVRALQDIVNQMCDVYQSQLSIEQNDLMKIFTIITSVFLPLTLITGWYGMNFKVIPELDWKYGYPCVIAASIVIVLILLWFFRRRKWI